MSSFINMTSVTYFLKISKFIEIFSKFLSTLGLWISSFSSSFTLVIGMLLLVPVVLYYILKNFYEIREQVKSFLVHHQQHRLYHILKESEEIVKGYVSGTLLVSFVLSIIASIYFSILGTRKCDCVRDVDRFFKYHSVCWSNYRNDSSCTFWINGFGMDTGVCGGWW